MRKLLAISLLLCWSVAHADEELVYEIGWRQLEQQGRLVQGAIAPADLAVPFDRLVIASPGVEPKTVELLAIEKPALTSRAYAVTGQVSCEGLVEPAYLELWSYFASGQFEVVRTQAQAGPMAAFQGTTGWRSFSLPFTVPQGLGCPERLVVYLVMPGSGKVALGPLRIVQYPEGWRGLARTATDWAGVVLAVAVVGCLLAALGRLAARGKARHFVTATLVLLLALGAGAVLVGLACLLRTAPGTRATLLLVLGAALAVLPLAVWQRFRRRYEEHELRHMDAIDAP